MAEPNDATSFLESLTAPDEKERLRAYRKFTWADDGLQFPLDHFLLATVMDPLVRFAPLGDDVWPLLDATLDPSRTGQREVSMDGWRDLLFAGLRRAIEEPRSRGTSSKAEATGPRAERSGVTSTNPAASN